MRITWPKLAAAIPVGIAACLAAASVAYAVGRLTGEARAQYQRGFAACEAASSLAQREAIEAARKEFEADEAKRREALAAELTRSDAARQTAVTALKAAQERADETNPDYRACLFVARPDGVRWHAVSPAARGDSDAGL